jgi:DNA polymerase-3 subunit chi
MPRVDFYEVREPDWEAALCRLVETAYEAGERAYVLASSEAHARRLDDLLWTFRDESFVPHELWQGEATLPDPAPVLVGWLQGNPAGPRCLFLAGPAAPADVVGFERIVDLVPAADPTLKNAARGRYRAFRDAGFDVAFHPAGP